MKLQGLDLSVCMIVKNEASQIAEALSNFQPFADELVVVDTGSTDNTRSIVERFTPHLFHFEWCGDFSAARNFSLAKARGQYIVWLDADDRLDREMQQKLCALKSYFDRHSAYYLLLQDTDAHGFNRSCYQLRCLPNMHEIRFRGRVHEMVYPSVVAAGLKTVTTDIVISHHGYTDQQLSRRKAERNLALLEKEREEGRDDEHIHFYLASTYKTLGRNTEAIEAMECALIHLEKQLFQLPPGMRTADFRPTIEAYLFLAPLYLERQDQQRALRCLARVNAVVQSDAATHFRMGCLYQELRQHMAAVDHFGRSLGAGSSVGFHPSVPLPARSEILLSMAFSLLCLDQRNKAQEALQMACEQGCPLHEGWESVGSHAIRHGYPQMAMKAYENALAAGQLSADGYCNLGMLYAQHGSPQKALTCYGGALKMEPKHKEAMANAAHLHLSLGHPKEARRLFQQLIDEGVKDVDLSLALAIIAVREKDRDLIRTATGMLKEAPDLRGLCDQENGRLFFTEIARHFASHNKPGLARWAKEIAFGL